MDEKEIVEIVARYLKDKHPGGATLEALAQGVRREQDWWYVPVRPSVEPERRYEYYEVLAGVEAALEDTEHLTVLLLPTAQRVEISLKTSLCSTPSTPAKGYEAIMTWYAAHLILLTKFLDGVQDSYPIWENVVLINAETPDEAYAIADKMGEAEASVGSHSHNGRPPYGFTRAHAS